MWKVNEKFEKNAHRKVSFCCLTDCVNKSRAPARAAEKKYVRVWEENFHTCICAAGCCLPACLLAHSFTITSVREKGSALTFLTFCVVVFSETVVFRNTKSTIFSVMYIHTYIHIHRDYIEIERNFWFCCCYKLKKEKRKIFRFLQQETFSLDIWSL